MEHKGEQSYSVSFGRAMMQGLELLRLTKKGTSQEETTLKSEEMKHVAIAIIELPLSEGIGKSVIQCSQSVEMSVQ